jgi:hypothetical protein
LTNEVGCVEEGGKSCSILGMTEFSNERGTRNDTEDDTETKDHTGEDVHADYFTELVQYGPNEGQVERGENYGSERNLG